MLEVKFYKVYNLENAAKVSQYPTLLGKEMPILDNTCSYDDELRAKRLGSSPSNSGEDNFLSGILVAFDVVYPLYWAVEFERYHFAQIVSSQSTMHSITSLHNIPFPQFVKLFNEYVDIEIIHRVYDMIKQYNTTENLNEREKLFMKIKSNLPQGFQLQMHVVTNYLQLKTIYKQRKNHRLEDWKMFIEWMESLPYFLELIGEKKSQLPTAYRGGGLC